MDKLFLRGCPFCGETPELPSGHGTQYEIICDCGMAQSSIQIIDLMSYEERQERDFKDGRYPQEFIDRAMREAVENWNQRA